MHMTYAVAGCKVGVTQITQATLNTNTGIPPQVYIFSLKHSMILVGHAYTLHLIKLEYQNISSGRTDGG